MAITYNSLNIDDGINYIVTSISGDRSTPKKVLTSTPVARREGAQFLGDDFESRNIDIKGVVFGDSEEEFLQALDTLKQTCSEPQSVLQIVSGRVITATSSQISIEDTIGGATHATFSMSLMCADPFFLGSSQTVNFSLSSGVSTSNYTVTVSGTAYSRPLITLTAPAGTGDTPINYISIGYTPTGESISWSGTLPYSSYVSFDYNEFAATVGGTEEDWAGVYSRWQPGSATFSLTVSGNVGLTGQLTYQPAYL